MCPTNDGVEDTEHFLLLCPSFNIQRSEFLARVSVAVPGADLGEKLRGARRAVGAMDEGVRERSPRGNFWRPRPLLFRK